jgi:hypothetical protein
MDGQYPSIASLAGHEVHSYLNLWSHVGVLWALIIRVAKLQKDYIGP